MDTNATKPKLLLADDSVTIRKVVEMTFAEEDIEVFTVSDGETAMLKFVETQPDIVLAHIGLPETNGYQLCEMIKQDETTRHIPVLLLAGSFEPFDEAEAARVGADGFLTKPFVSVRDLVARVKDLLGHAPPPVSVAPETDDIENLYQSSFSKTAEIYEFATVEDSFPDDQFDDEMIETSSPVVANAESVSHMSAVASAEQSSREFDWSPDAVVTAADHANGQDSPVEDDSVALGQSVSHEKNDGNTTAEVRLATETETTELERVVDDVEEPSDDFIELVARRVVEKLSDNAIREIAQQEVPRIAERVVREALGQDKKQ
jgi:DNA-binding response OmpR family regulator